MLFVIVPSSAGSADKVKAVAWSWHMVETFCFLDLLHQVLENKETRNASNATAIKR
jgi:hypothetical protein